MDMDAKFRSCFLIMYHIFLIVPARSGICHRPRHTTTKYFDNDIHIEKLVLTCLFRII